MLLHKPPTVVTISVILLVSVYVSTSELKAITYKQNIGEACNTTSECDYTKWLICKKSVCECVNQDEVEMYYNESKGTCVGLAGKRCGDYYLKHGRGVLPFDHHNHRCTSGASCHWSSSASKCYCDSQRYFQTEDGFCEPYRNINESCSHNEQCKGLLSCGPHNICTCSGSNKWDDWEKTCVTSVTVSGRGSCADENIRCGRGADCQDTIQNRQNTYQCYCRPGYRELSGNRTRDGNCYAEQGTACAPDFFDQTAENQCLPGLFCTGGYCQCKYGSFHQVYDFATEKCLSLLGSPCLHTSDCKELNSVCKNFTGVTQCSCEEGSVEYGRKCYKGYGQKCRFNGDTECDKSSGLECSYKGICECPELQDFNPITTKCMPLVGASCNLKYWKNPCWPGCVCIPFRGMENNENGLCVCETGLKLVKDRKCYW